VSKFSVTILGNASASPTLSRNHTAQLVNISEQYFLMDCGEGTQLRLREHRIKLQRIHHIFISHLHGDHYLGLVGLMQTMHLLGRVAELHIYCVGAIQEIVDIHLKLSNSQLSYPTIYHKIKEGISETVFENEKIEILSIPLKHKIACSGFLFKEKPKPRRVNPKAITNYKIPRHLISGVKLGDDYTTDTGETVKNKHLTLDSLPSFSYAFCSDTKYDEKICDIIQGVSLLYHEATFIEEHAKRAAKTLHSTAKQAATIALKSNSNKLIIGHLSNRYSNLNVFLDEAKSIFKNTELADQGREFFVAENG